ncbi:MAG: hypothetical protein Kow0092_24700 [Deferrisomatales bacterium]
MSDYRVEKRPQAVRLLLADGAVLEGELFVAPFSPAHSGPQEVPELVEEAGAALPFRRSDGSFVLVGTAAVAAVGLRASSEEALLLVRLPARARLVGGHQVDGRLLGEEGAGRRASDFLNAPGRWIRMASADGLYWVAKTHLLVLEPRDAPARA